ncbi:hypothetical protein BJY24_007837 [Nocardia transvalensis]|uniref:Uncharacterized protein n=1 Tax=Nocardia transvalensis TaxID=37333 RepID=A0A7W9PMZ8_9NOCA|nr:hypothetical protein [Nocardia transvalensis]
MCGLLPWLWRPAPLVLREPVLLMDLPWGPGYSYF